jgi:DNA-binding transcriptional regulator PaaX
MHKLETEAARKRRRDAVQHALLWSVAAAGLLLVAVAAPNTLQLLGKFTGNKHKFNYRLKSVASRLAHKGLVRFVKKNGRNYMELTDAGKRAIEMEQEVKALRARSRKRWDGRWRMVVFDIPEKHRGTRLRLRTMLRSLGFMQLQASVWVYPHDCEEVVALIKTELRAGSNVLYAIVEKIELDEKLRTHFNLR